MTQAGKCMASKRYEIVWPEAGLCPLAVYDRQQRLYLIAAQELTIALNLTHPNPNPNPTSSPRRR